MKLDGYDFGWIGRKARKFVDWMDTVPGMMAFGAGMGIGLIIPTKLIFALIIGGIIYTAIKLHAKEAD